MGFLYSLFLKLLYPTSIALILFVVAAILRQGGRARRICYGLAITILLVSGNGWLTGALISHLEQQHLPLEPIPTADAILVLSGGVYGRNPPRTTVEFGDAGDRVLYGAHLFRQGKAPQIICTGNVGTGGLTPRPESEDMAELLGMVGIPQGAIITETRSENTREHATNLCPVFASRKIRRVLLVTSAMHMPRSVAVFRRNCAAVEFVPAPTDFRVTRQVPAAWYRKIAAFIPTPRNFLDFSDALHEYLGMAYYRWRGWI